MKNPFVCLFIAGVASLLAGIAPVQAQNQTINGNLTVTGTGDFQGNTFNLGSWSGNNSEPGVVFYYTDGTTAGVNFLANRNAAIWQWSAFNGSTSIPLMKLDQGNQLTLYSGTLPAITLSPSGTSAFTGNIVFSGTDNRMPWQGVTGTSSILTKHLADGLYLSLSAASGFLQNGNAITVGPGGNVGIGTTNPQATLSVNGDVSFDNGNITSDGYGDLWGQQINMAGPVQFDNGNITSDGVGDLWANSLATNTINIGGFINGIGGFGNQVLVDCPEAGDGEIKFSIYGPWGGATGSNILFL